jgi:hypothetical protein
MRRLPSSSSFGRGVDNPRYYNPPAQRRQSIGDVDKRRWKNWPRKCEARKGMKQWKKHEETIK